jgi:hypothetical protein
MFTINPTYCAGLRNLALHFFKKVILFDSCRNIFYLTPDNAAISIPAGSTSRFGSFETEPQFLLQSRTPHVRNPHTQASG